MLEAGASADLELAYTLADGLEYVKQAIAAGLEVDSFAPRVSFFFGIGMNVMTEVAKLRAARTIWAELMAQFSPKNPKSSKLRTHCQTSGWSLTAQDPYNNVARTTIEAISAICGHTQSLHTNALDEAIALPTDESAMIARNTQLILQQETDILKAVDPFGGARYLEDLTRKLIQSARSHIREVDEVGGMAEAIARGIPKMRIEQAAAKRQARIDSAEEIIVGVNKYQATSQRQIPVREIDNASVRRLQVERLEQVKADRDNGRVEESLNRLSAAASEPNGRLLEACIDAARARTTLGEISEVLVSVFGRHVAVAQSFTGVYASEYAERSTLDEVLQQSDIFFSQTGRRPRILVAKLGQDGHDRGARVIATAFADIGYDVDIGPLFQTPAETARQAIENDVHVVGISTLAGSHKTLIPELIQHLEKLGRGDILVIAGGVIPEQDIGYLKDAGVVEVFGPGTLIPEAAGKLLAILIDNLASDTP